MIEIDNKQAADPIVLKDINGQYHAHDVLDLGRQLSLKGFVSWGLSIDCIMELRSVYLKRGGKLPVTIECIREIFK